MSKSIEFKCLNYDREDPFPVFTFKNDDIIFYIHEPLRETKEKWNEFYNSLKNNQNNSLYFGWCDITFEDGAVKFFCETRGGQGGEGEITYKIDPKYCMDAFKEAKNCKYLE